MDDNQMRETLRRRLDGHWEYVCRVTSEEPFEENEWGRGGVMTITMSLHWTGVTARIVAERLWATNSPQDTLADRTPLVHAIQWNAVGAVIFYEGGLSFEYFSGDGHGVTKDAFKLFEEDGRVHIHPGTFEHQRGDGKHVEGTVRLRPMRDFEDFQWAPKGINPAGTFTTRDVSGGEVSRKTMDLQLVPGDANSLAKVLSQIEVSTEDINQIKEIVESEKPKQGSIGPRAADWIGRMVAKSLTGAWEAGKGIASTVLPEIILRFYSSK